VGFSVGMASCLALCAKHETATKLGIS
jgi:hypothetical protein